MKQAAKILQLLMSQFFFFFFWAKDKFSEGVRSEVRANYLIVTNQY